MRTLVFSALAALLAVPALSSPTERFDLATFTPPVGWSRTESGGALVLSVRKVRDGRTEFCQIQLFPSRETQASPLENFQTEWQTRIASLFGVGLRPAPQSEVSPDGWTVVTAFTDIDGGGTPTRVILINATGFGRTVSVMVIVSPGSYHSELTEFFNGLRFQKLSEGVGSSGEVRSSQTPGGSPPAGYVYTVPDRWVEQNGSDRITLTSPAYQNGERCQITMLPFRASNGPLPDDAIGTFRQLFRVDPLTTYPSPPPRLESGLSPFGWEYFRIRKLVGGQEGEARTMGAILLLVKSGNQVATIVGTSKDFLVSNCFGELISDAWPKFFYSLQFGNAQGPAVDEAEMRKRLAGEWIMATGSLGLHYTFLPNGRYGRAGATQYRQRVSNNEVLATTQAYFGDGSYAVHGNQIVLTGDDHRRSVFYFRVQQESRDSGRTWKGGLCLLDPSASGEVCYRKE